MGSTRLAKLGLNAKQYRNVSVGVDRVTLRQPRPGAGIEMTLNGVRYEIGRMASAFPLSSAQEAIVFYDKDGDEICLMRDVGALDDTSGAILREELEKAYFMPQILAISSMEEALGVETWEVLTNKGERTFEVRNPRHSVRAIGKGRVIINDVDANRYEVRDWRRLDRKSISLLEKYL